MIGVTAVSRGSEEVVGEVRMRAVPDYQEFIGAKKHLVLGLLSHAGSPRKDHALGVLRVRSSCSMRSSLRSVSSRRRTISGVLLSEVMTSQHGRMRPQPQRIGGHAGRGLS